MEDVTRTVKVKLNLDSNAQQLLHQTAEQFNTAVNNTIQNAQNNDGYYITSQSQCDECGYEIDGDYNAAKNVGLRLVETLLDDQSSSGLGNSHLALKSGVLSPNGEYVAYDSISESSEGESTLKPTAKAVGR